MNLKRTALTDGVNLTVVTDAKFKTDITSISFIGGTGKEAAVCSALLTGVLSRSCRKYPSLMELNRTLDGLYDAQLVSDVIRRGYDHIPTFTVSSLNNRYSLDKTDIRGGALELLYNIVFEPDLKNGCFDQKILESEKLQLEDAISGIRNTRSSYALRRCTEALMKDHPDFAPRLGFEGASGSVTAKQLTDHYINTLKNSTVEILSVSADDDSRIYEFADKTARTLGKRNGSKITEAEYETPGKRIKRESETALVSQDVLCVGCSCDGTLLDGMAAERALFFEIFYQNPTSRLFENVREKLSLCYYCSALPMTDLKKLIIYAGIDGKNAKAAEDEIRKQIKFMQKGVTEDELRRCRLALKNDLLAIADSPSRTASWYSVRALYGDLTETTYDFSSALDKVSTADVERAASTVKESLIFTMKGAAENEA